MERILRNWIICVAFLARSYVLAGAVQVYPYLMNPRKHPDDVRRYVKPPDRGTFKNKIQFMALRSMNQDYMKDLDIYTKRDRLGDIIWPHYAMINAGNLREMVAELKKRDLYLFDIWGFVPGSGPGGDWRQFPLPQRTSELFKTELGNCWLGMDNGEQDGRYVGGYAGEQVPFGNSRMEQYLAFQHHFEKMGDLLGNRLATLVSLNFGHYFMREGIYTMIGAETAQGLPNAQIYYSFIRGAGKQYGVPWFGNVSIYNRWGYKDYDKDTNQAGPTKGTSLSLMKRLLYNLILYNSVAVGYEAGFYSDGKLSPIGRIQQKAVEWYEKNGDPGVMHTPIALMVDFFSGWSFPRHLYTRESYKVWGALPYGEGDYLTDDVLDLLYPGYQDSSYFRDERGFMAPTPFGDAVDCLMSDAPLWILQQYPVLVLAGRMMGGVENTEKFEQYVHKGGHLVLTAANAIRLFSKGIAGITVLPETQTFSTDQGMVTLHRLSLTPAAQPIEKMGNGAISVARGTFGKGQVTVFSSPYGITEEPQCDLPVTVGENKPLNKPYPLLWQVKNTLASIFRDQMIFSTGAEDIEGGLSLTTCRKGKGIYTVAICNPSWQEKPFALTARAGTISKIVELPTDEMEKIAVGYQADGMTNNVGKDTSSTIAGGSIRIFRIFTNEEEGTRQVAVMPETLPASNPVGSGLSLRNINSIQREILLRPTFFRHFDTVMVDWRYLAERTPKTMADQAGWLKRQGVRIIVDLSSGCNLFPDLRLINNDPQPYSESMETIANLLSNMNALGSRDLLISLNRLPENNYDWSRYHMSMTATLRSICRKAATLGISVHLRQSPQKGTPSLSHLVNWVNRVKEPNFKGAPSIAALINEGEDYHSKAKALADFPCDLVLVSDIATDMHGQLWSLHRPLFDSKNKHALSLLMPAARKAGRILVLDISYSSRDAEYLDAKILNETTPEVTLKKCGKNGERKIAND